MQSVRKAAERIAIHRRSLPWPQAPENDVRGVKTPRRSLGHKGTMARCRERWCARCGGRFPPGHSRPTRDCGSDRANLRPRISPAEPPWCLIWALTFAPGKGVSGNSKEDFVSCAHERASVIARLSAADRARIFSANRSMTITVEGRAAARMVLACCATDRQYPRIDEEDGSTSLALP